MRSDIDPRRVAEIMAEANKAIGNKGFTQPEVMLALTELVGRAIVDMCRTPVAASTLQDFVKKHLDDTVHIGLQAKGQTSPLILPH